MNKYCSQCGRKLDNNKCNYCDKGSTSNAFAIAGFSLSIISSVLCCGLFNIVSLGLSIAGLANWRSCNSGKGLSIFGIIISLFPLILLILIIVLKIILGYLYVPFSGFSI